MRRTLSLLLTPAIAMSSAGCSLAGSATQSVTIIPSHPRAQIIIDGVPKGTGVQSVELKRDRSHSVLAQCKDSSGVATVYRELSTTGVLDIIGGLLILVPFIGLFAPGAYSLSPENVSVAIPDASGCNEQTA